MTDSSIKTEPVVTQQDTVCKASWTVLLVYVDLASCLGIHAQNTSIMTLARTLHIQLPSTDFSPLQFAPFFK